MRAVRAGADRHALDVEQGGQVVRVRTLDQERDHRGLAGRGAIDARALDLRQFLVQVRQQLLFARFHVVHAQRVQVVDRRAKPGEAGDVGRRSEENTSELQSLMRISYAVSCLKKKKLDRDTT